MRAEFSGLHTMIVVTLRFQTVGCKVSSLLKVQETITFRLDIELTVLRYNQWVFTSAGATDRQTGRRTDREK